MRLFTIGFLVVFALLSGCATTGNEYEKDPACIKRSEMQPDLKYYAAKSFPIKSKGIELRGKKDGSHVLVIGRKAFEADSDQMRSKSYKIFMRAIKSHSDVYVRYEGVSDPSVNTCFKRIEAVNRILADNCLNLSAYSCP